MKLKVNQGSCVKGVVWFISLFLGFTNFLLYGIAIRGLLFHKGDPIILKCAIEGTMTLVAFIVIQLFYRQMKPTIDRLEKYEDDRNNPLH